MQIYEITRVLRLTTYVHTQLIFYFALRNRQSKMYGRVPWHMETSNKLVHVHGIIEQSQNQQKDEH